MAFCNHSRREVDFKIVYCGTPEGGKTTNLRYIHKKLDPHFRGDMISLATAENRTLFFDFLPVKATSINGYQTKFHLYTVPGQQVYTSNRAIVLQGVDAIIFVADSDPLRMNENLQAFQDTRQALEMNGLDPDEVPMVLQFNKRDLPGAMAPDFMDEMLNAQHPSFLTCALSGYQIFATLDHITQIVLKNFHSSAVNGRERIVEENVASSSKVALCR
ncbi:MAG: GTPase domain-containing protein [Verrucomicrobiales bacterium]|nr:GTPase domain-containing protein [Verrucomicrobiales bacterium]